MRRGDRRRHQEGPLLSSPQQSHSEGRTLGLRALVQGDRTTPVTPPPPCPHKGKKVPASEKQKLVNREVSEAEKTSRHLTAFLTQISASTPKQGPARRVKKLTSGFYSRMTRVRGFKNRKRQM